MAYLNSLEPNYSRLTSNSKLAQLGGHQIRTQDVPGSILFSFLPPANEVWEGYVFTGVCHSVHREGGHAWLLPGGMHGCSWGVCVVARGAYMVAPGGACVVAWGGMHGCSWGERAWLILGGMHGCSGGGHAWLLWGGMHGCSGGHAWLLLGGRAWFFRWDMVNEQAVRILLECILVDWNMFAIPQISHSCQNCQLCVITEKLDWLTMQRLQKIPTNIYFLAISVIQTKDRERDCQGYTPLGISR